MAARNKDVRREWIVFSFHCGKLGLDITYGRSESFQCILKPCSAHDCSGFTQHWELRFLSPVESSRRLF